MAYMKASDAREGVKSCLRALDVIDYFCRTGTGARTIDISKALDVPNSSMDELLRTLADTGYLSFDPATKYYSPSYKLIAAARGIERDFFGDNGIMELLQDLRVATGASAFLNLQKGCLMETVAEVPGRWTIDVKYTNEVVYFDEGHWKPGTTFAAVLLAQQSNVGVVALAARAQSLGVGPAGPALMKQLVDRVALTRSLGFAFGRRNGKIVDSLAMPFQLPRVATPYAVGIVGDALFENEKDVTSMAAAVRDVVLTHVARLRQAPQAALH